MTLSPKLRSYLTALVVVLTAISAALPSFTDIPPGVGYGVAGLLAGLGALGIVPPQTGGTQVGVTSPVIVEPPAADVAPEPPLGGGL